MVIFFVRKLISHITQPIFIPSKTKFLDTVQARRVIRIKIKSAEI